MNQNHDIMLIDSDQPNIEVCPLYDGDILVPPQVDQSVLFGKRASIASFHLISATNQREKSLPNLALSGLSLETPGRVLRFLQLLILHTGEDDVLTQL